MSSLMPLRIDYEGEYKQSDLIHPLNIKSRLKNSSSALFVSHHQQI